MQADYQKIATEARREILTAIHRAGTSHISSNFSVVDIATVLYENLKEGDEVVWSKGWAAATIYYFLYKQGKITRKQFETFPEEPFLGLAETTVPGVHVSGGSMGQGLGVAIGMALAKKRAQEPGNIYCVMSDGEMQEGTTWEGAQLAGQHKLDNLVVFTDWNKWTAMGRTEDVADIQPAEEKWNAFKWDAKTINGHNYQEIENSILSDRGNKPTMIVADTVKGQGVKMFADKILYHYAHVDEYTYKKAMRELNL